MNKVLLVDNVDSFTYNIVQALEVAGARVEISSNDITSEEVRAYNPTHLVISPGPGRPEDAGNVVDLVRQLGGEIPTLGVCLGHQALAQSFGARVERSPMVVHGKSSRVYHDNRTIYDGLPNPFQAGRYHSLTVADGSLPPEMEIAAYTSRGEIMGIRHRTLPLEGVQFHPESILTPEGDRLLANFLEYAMEGVT